MVGGGRMDNKLSGWAPEDREAHEKKKSALLEAGRLTVSTPYKTTPALV